MTSFRHFLVAAVGAALVATWHVRAVGQEPRFEAPRHVREAVARGERTRVIVGYRVNSYRPEGLLSEASAGRQRAENALVAERVLGRLPAEAAQAARRFDSIPYFATQVSQAALEQLQNDPDVVSVEEDTRQRPTLYQSVPLVGAPKAWAEGFNGAGWTVAILDTGVDYTHPFLTGKAVSEACYSTNDPQSSSSSLCPGGNASSTAAGSGLNCSLGDCYHGTHVAGIAVGSNGSFSGVAPGAKFITIQVFSRIDSASECGAATPCVLSWTSDEISALNRVYSLRTSYNIAAVNMSLGGSSYTSTCDYVSSSMKSAIDLLRSAGIATVIAAGNGGNNNAISFPGCISSAISVGSTTKSDQLSSFTNLASFLGLLAPGSSIYSSIPGGGYTYMSGTSMATPHVAGTWAIMRQRSPTATVSQILATLQNTGAQIVDSLSGLTYRRIQVDSGVNALPVAMLAMDAPGAAASVTQPFTVSGWAIDPTAPSGTGIDRVDVYLFPSGSGTAAVGTASTYGTYRPDVASVYGSPFTYSGYQATLQGVSPGSYDVVAFGHSTVSGTYNVSLRRSITIAASPPPIVTIDAPANGATVPNAFTVSGWAIGQGAASGTGVDAVHVYLFPKGSSTPVVGNVSTYGVTRTDVGNAFGAQFTRSGFTTSFKGLPGGVYQLAAWARSTITGNFDGLLTRTITISPPPQPVLTLDVPVATATVGQPFTVSGWAVDPNAGSGTGVDAVHVYLTPAGSSSPSVGKVTSYGGTRVDVGNIYGSQFNNSGFTTSFVGIPNGVYTVSVFGHRTTTGAFDMVLTRTITVTGNVPAQAVIDQPAASSSLGQPFTVSGWALDPSAIAGTGVSEVHVYLFQNGVAIRGEVATYGTSRPDVANWLGSQFLNSGYAVSMQGVAAGSYQLVVFGRLTSTGAFSLIKSEPLTVF